MRRRHFISSAAAAATVVGCGAGDGDGETDDSLRVDLVEVMRAYFEQEQLENARTVGAAYARRFESDEAYDDDIAAVIDILRPVETIDEAVDALRDQVQDDFLTAEMVVVDGWALGTTEARLGALADDVDA